MRNPATQILDSAIYKLDILNAATSLGDLRSPPGNRLEALRGDYKGYHSIRINAYIQGQLEPGIAGKGYILSWSEYWRNSDHYNEGEILTLGYTDDFAYYDVYVESGPVLCWNPMNE